MKIIYLKSTGQGWQGVCETSRSLNRTIVLLDIFKWQKKGYQVEFINGVFL